MELNLIEQAIEKVAQRSHVTKELEIKRIVEALLFSTNYALTLEKIKEIINTSYPIRSRDLKKIIDDLAYEYKKQQRAFQIDHIAGGYLLRTEPTMRPYIEQLHQDRRAEKLSPAATETLAIVAYRGPITRREIEKLRGVDSSGTVAALVERGLIEEVGRKDTPGRPALYSTTSLFLHHFGLKHLEELTVSTPV